ncbi:hypothetical protein [Gilvibacter sp.]|uniref:hypothetical protein n=1 Tax=Gilvibacter sp. TaxID=2729997 RepID=UPI0025BC1A24|nr:hypothetical protein [Gilvibacter sp.]NQX77509.1 hypothetical protein [Gilvibacter sp.]
MKELKTKQELIDMMTIALLHVTQGLHQGRAIANLLLSQTCFDYHWAERCEIGLQGVYLNGMDMPLHYHVFAWASALSEQAAQGFEFNARTSSPDEAAKIRAFVIDACRAIKQAILRDGELPEQTHNKCVRLLRVNYTRLAEEKVCGLSIDPIATRERYCRRTNKVSIPMRVECRNPALN